MFRWNGLSRFEEWNRYWIDEEVVIMIRKNLEIENVD